MWRNLDEHVAAPAFFVSVIFINSKPTLRLQRRVESPLRRVRDLCPQQNGEAMGGRFDNEGDRTMRVLRSRC
jgi:hypothetical protein